jgi:hypothetical protein
MYSDFYRKVFFEIDEDMYYDMFTFLMPIYTL